MNQTEIYEIKQNDKPMELSSLWQEKERNLGIEGSSRCFSPKTECYILDIHRTLVGKNFVTVYSSFGNDFKLP